MQYDRQYYRQRLAMVTSNPADQTWTQVLGGLQEPEAVPNLRDSIVGRI